MLFSGTFSNFHSHERAKNLMRPSLNFLFRFAAFACASSNGFHRWDAVEKSKPFGRQNDWKINGN